MDFKKAIEAAMEPLTQDISALCQINSVEGEPQPGMHPEMRSGCELCIQAFMAQGAERHQCTLPSPCCLRDNRPPGGFREPGSSETW